VKRRFLIWIAIAVGACLVVQLVAYLFLLNSDALRASQQYARTDPMVTEFVGSVQLARLVPYDFALRFRHSLFGNEHDQYAHIDLWLVGAKNRGYLVVDLKSESGPWRVISAKLYPDGARPVTIGVSP
jgi:hypothetical protein